MKTITNWHALIRRAVCVRDRQQASRNASNAARINLVVLVAIFVQLKVCSELFPSAYYKYCDNYAYRE